MPRYLAIIYLLQAFWPLLASGQDTAFVQKHSFPTPVRNVLQVNQEIFAKTGDGLYKLEGHNWEKQKARFEKTFVFYDNGWVETDYMPGQYTFPIDQMAHLVPQQSRTNASKAMVDNRLFVSTGGSLFEYRIYTHYRHVYGDRSVRQIYLENGLKFISTYAGIYINDTIRTLVPEYANGYLSKIRGRYFLSSDHLYEFTPPTGFREIPEGFNLFAGYSRKLIEFRDTIYALNTKSLNRFTDLVQLEPLHQGFEYFDVEQVGDRLLFCTQTGEVFAYDGKQVTRVFKLDSRIRDLYSFRNTVYVSSDAGVYTFNGKDSASLVQITRTPFSVMTLVDPQRNTWIATENGLFVMPDRKQDVIPVIPGVEFNRGALTLYEDAIYAGSISGIYIVDSYVMVRNFLPSYYNRKKVSDNDQRRRIGFIALGVLAFLAGGFLVYRKTRRHRKGLVLPQRDTGKTLTLDQIAADIRSQGIQTVDGMAEFYHTNTVQLNRRFKAFGTTPGRFMKQVKLAYARELLENKVPMEEVVVRVGYSASFIRKELIALNHAAP